jgi:hypothetical protein
VKKLRRAWGGDLFHLRRVGSCEARWKEYKFSPADEKVVTSSKKAHIVDPVPCYPVETPEEVEYSEQGDERRVKVVPEA